jgi:hypothetical protein
LVEDTSMVEDAYGRSMETTLKPAFSIAWAISM